MKIKITIGLFLAAFLLSAQSTRMNRDIEVAEKILETLLEEETMYEGDDFLVLGNNSKVEGTYLEGFGAMFSITSGNLIGPLALRTKKSKDKDRRDKSSKVTIIRQGKKRYHLDLEDMEANKEAIQKRFKEVVETFICDYGYLMRQLGADEKIVIRYGSNPLSIFQWDDRFSSLGRFDNLAIVSGNSGKVGPNYSATVTKKSIQDFQNDQITDTQLKDRIEFVFEEAQDRAEKYKDLDLFASVLSKVHKHDFDGEAFYLKNTSNYEKIDGIGAIFSWSVRQSGHSYFGFSSNQKIEWRNNGFTVIRGDEDKKEKAKTAREAEEKNGENLDKYYTHFLKTFKDNVIEYGSIVKSLEGKEALIFKLKFPSCEDCDSMPKKLELTAKKSTLDAYRKDQISLEKAISQLIVK